MDEDDETPTVSEQSAEDLRRRTKSGNRMVAALLVGVTAIFLAGAFGVAALVIYGPY
ncbi:hypothetical protein ACROSR_16490 [Roseovarius tibetensis]|uniref:hypothetical protein n=1 Tax=Roseovarius tibetensis TaxID=2685897 RepID=UPI003D7F563D